MSKANHHHTQEGDSSVALTWWITGVVCLGVFGAIFWLTGPGRSGAPDSATSAPQDQTLHIPTPDGMSWPELIIDVEALERERATQRSATSADAITAHPSSEALRDIVRQLNDHQFTTHPIPSRTMFAMEQELGVAVSEVVSVIEPVHFVLLGQPIFDDCARGLKALQEELAADTISLEEVIEDADFERHELYRKNCGNMLGELVTRGLVDDKGQWKDETSRALADILQRFRWANLIRLYIDPVAQLTPGEADIFVRWRVEDGDAFTLETRARFVEALYHHMPDYPEGVAEAMLAYEAGEKKNAAEILSRYLNQAPDNRFYRVMYEDLSRELSSP